MGGIPEELRWNPSASDGDTTRAAAPPRSRSGVPAQPVMPTEVVQRDTAVAPPSEELAPPTEFSEWLRQLIERWDSQQPMSDDEKYSRLDEHLAQLKAGKTTFGSIEFIERARELFKKDSLDTPLIPKNVEIAHKRAEGDLVGARTEVTKNEMAEAEAKARKDVQRASLDRRSQNDQRIDRWKEELRASREYVRLRIVPVLTVTVPCLVLLIIWANLVADQPGRESTFILGFVNDLWDDFCKPITDNLLGRDG